MTDANAAYDCRAEITEALGGLTQPSPERGYRGDVVPAECKLVVGQGIVETGPAQWSGRAREIIEARKRLDDMVEQRRLRVETYEGDRTYRWSRRLYYNGDQLVAVYIWQETNEGERYVLHVHPE